MHIDQYKTEESEYQYKYNDVHYRDAKDLMCSCFLNFCGCGLPESAMDLVMNCLKLIDDHHTAMTRDEWKEHYKTWCAEVEKVLPGDGLQYFMWYWLDAMGLTEHGSSVPGWLTEKGKWVLSDLQEIKAQRTEEE